MRNALKKAWAFTKKVIIAAKDKVVDFVRGCYQHTEAIALLTLSALGLNALMGELPFLFLLPMWIEATLVIPVLSVCIVALLCRSAEWRANRRTTSLELAA